jgi:hypothetical protein
MTLVSTLPSCIKSIQKYNKKGRHEQFTDSDSDDESDDDIDVSDATIITMIALFLFIFIYALYLTIVFWDVLEPWAKVLALIGLFTDIGGPVMTIIVVYISSYNGYHHTRTKSHK